MQNDIYYIQTLTNFNIRKRKELHRYFCSLSEEERIDIFHNQIDLMKINRVKRIKNMNIEFQYAMFLLAVNNLFKLESAISKKSQDINILELERIHTIRANRIKSMKKKKPSKLKKIIEVRFFELIKRLRGENLSWRDISRYVKKYHKLNVSHDYLCKLYKEIEEQKN